MWAALGKLFVKAAAWCVGHPEIVNVAKGVAIDALEKQAAKK